jgi:chromate transporter
MDTDLLKEKLINNEEEISHDNRTRDMNKKEVLKTCLLLGVTSFGGPIAHIGLYERTLVNKYISEEHFKQLFALCSAIPGPTSSQLLTAVAIVKTKSILSGIISFLAFNLPALLVMLFIATMVRNFEVSFDQDTYLLIRIFVIGLSQSAVAIVLLAARNLTRKVMSSYYHLSIIAISFITYTIFNNYITMLALMVLGGLIILYTNDNKSMAIKDGEFIISQDIAFIGFPALITFKVVFIALHLLNYIYSDNMNIFLVTTFYRIGSLVIGGGHVVIPMMITELASKGLISEADILQSFSLVSLLPGPMFNISGYVGTLINGLLGGILSALFIFLAGMLLLFASLGFMKYLARNSRVQLVLSGISSAAIGFIFTSCLILWYDSCWMNKIYHPLLGCLNVLISFLLMDSFPNATPLILIFGAIYSYIVIMCHILF